MLCTTRRFEGTYAELSRIEQCIMERTVLLTFSGDLEY